MENPFLLVMAAMNLIAAAFFALTAKTVAGRPLSSQAQLAGTAFMVSWAMLAFMAASDAARLVLAWAPGDDVALYATFARFKILATALMIVGFGYYVAFLWTGKKAVGVPIILFAASHALLFLYMMDVRVPSGVVSGAWGAVMIFERPSILFGESNLVTYFYFFAPPILLAVAFMSLIFLFTEHQKRLRILGTGLVIFGYQGTGFLLFSPRVDLDHVVNPLALLLVVVIAWFAWWAHRQPAIVGPQGTDPANSGHSPKES